MALLRPGQAGDAGRLAAIHVDAWRDAYAGVLPTARLAAMSADRLEDFWRQRLTARAAASERVIVAEHPPGEIVGFGSCGLCREPVAGYRGEIFTLYVDPWSQGQGVGRGLIGSLFLTLKTVGAENALLWVIEANPSRFFYEAIGGRVVARKRTRYWGTTLDLMAFGWPDLDVPLYRRRADARRTS